MILAAVNLSQTGENMQCRPELNKKIGRQSGYRRKRPGRNGQVGLLQIRSVDPKVRKNNTKTKESNATSRPNSESSNSSTIQQIDNAQGIISTFRMIYSPK